MTKAISTVTVVDKIDFSVTIMIAMRKVKTIAILSQYVVLGRDIWRVLSK